MRYALLLLLMGCSFDPVITRKASIRAEASGRLESCLHKPGVYEFNAPGCQRENAEFCRLRGLEPTCGVDGVWQKRYK